MWFASVIIISAISFVFFIRTIKRNRDPYLIFVVSAIYSRYLLSAYPNIVNPKIVAGISLNALGAIIVIFAGFLVVQKKYFRLSLLIPLYVFLGIMVFSGIVNLEIKGLITGVIRLMYLITLQLALFVALQRLGPERVFGAILTVFILPVGLQAASIVLSQPKGAGRVGAQLAGPEESTGISYIGSYFHESGFSIMMMTMLVVAMFWRPQRSALFWLIVAAGIVGLAFANYRTTVLSTLPIILAIIVTRYYSAFVHGQRAAALTAAVIVGLPVAYFAISLAPELIDRFANLAYVADFDYLMSPVEFTASDRELLSGRIYIWSKYLEAIANSDISSQIIGLGPESWRSKFHLYAHNTYVSYYYEFGIIGVSIFALYWISNLVLCFRVSSGVTFIRIFSAYLGFTILSLATMPLWQIEGNLLLAILNGTLMFEVSKSMRPGGPPKHQPSNRDRTAIKSEFNRLT